MPPFRSPAQKVRKAPNQKSKTKYPESSTPSPHDLPTAASSPPVAQASTRACVGKGTGKEVDLHVRRCWQGITFSSFQLNFNSKLGAQVELNKGMIARPCSK
jgi:hypothetical protein